MDSIVNLYPSLPFLDVVETNVIKNNRFHCTRGWDIDLDDGSSNYHIYNNLCLNGGLKLREGYGRVAENNIIINNSLHPHVWYEKGNDIFKHNIVGADYAPIGIKVWGKEIDSNFFVLKSSLLAAQQNHTDKNSLCGNPMFFNSDVDDFTVCRTSDALKIGFENFLMKEFGVVSTFLKSKALKAPTPDTKIFSPVKKGETVKWLGAQLKNIGLGERSAAGLFDENGVFVLKVSGGSLAQKSGLRERDVIRKINNKPVNNIAEFLAATQINTWLGELQGTIIRNQAEQKITLILR